MHILHLDSGRSMRGGQWQVLYLLRELRERGHDATLLARRGGELLARARSEKLHARPLTVAALASRLSWAQVVHAHDARTHTLAALSAVPTVVSRRVSFDVRRGLLSRWKYAGADHYIAISRFVAGRLSAAGIKSDAITVVYDGVPPVEEGFAPEGRIIAPATSDPMKGSDLLEQAARLAGVDICFSGNLMQDLRGARLFVYISRSEGLGSAALLAMAHGIPVVASRVGGLPETVEDNASGLLVENDPEQIARAIRAMVSRPEVLAQMGAIGRKRAELYSIPKMVDGTVGVYEKVLTNA